MANIITSYDKSLKEKVFIVRGEESYARTTDCMLTEILHNGERREDWNTHLDYMLLEFRIDVVRDVGASEVVLYDNDVVLGVYPFDTNSHYIDLKFEDSEHDNRIMLNYDVEHNLYAKYMGNKQCLKSQSKTYSFYEAMPDAYNCSLSLLESDEETPLSIDYDTGDTVSLKVKIDAETEVGQEYVAGNDIEIYVDGVKLEDDYTTGIGGITPSIEIEDLTDGEHTITARFNGTEYLAFSSTTMDISVGYVASIISYPSYLINNNPFDASVKVTDYLNNPQQGFTVTQISSSVSATTNGNGMAYFNSIHDDDGELSFVSASPSLVNYNSNIVDITDYENVTVSLSQSSTITANNRAVTLTGKVNGVSEPVTVNLSNGGTLTTNNQGKFSVIYLGEGAGDVSLTASVYGSSASVTIEDVIQYWKAPSTLIDREYVLCRMGLTDVSNGYKLVPNTNPDAFPSIRFPKLSFDYTIEFDVVSMEKVSSSGNVYAISEYQDTPCKQSYISISSFTLNKSDHLKFDSSTNGVYVNNVDVASSSPNEFIFGFVPSNTKSMIIDNVKVKRL